MKHWPNYCFPHTDKGLDEVLASAGVLADHIQHFRSLSQPSQPDAPAPPQPPPISPPPRSRTRPRKGYQRPHRPPIPLPSELRFLSHNLRKKPIVSSQILRHLRKRLGHPLPPSNNQNPILPHVYAYGSGTKATIVSNISQDRNSRGEHGSVLVCSRLITPLPRPDTEGLLAAAILTLPAAPPTLLVSVYAPSTDVHRSKIENILRPLMHQYPNHVLGGDTNCIMCPELDRANLQTDNEWPWLRRQVTSDSPCLIDTFRHFHPTARSFSRYPSPCRASSSRLDHICISPAASEFFAPPSATIQTDDETSDDHPVTYTSQDPPRPFSETPTTKRKVFRKQTERERSEHHDSLAPLAQWCESTLPHFECFSSADIEHFTDVVLEEVASSYHTITTPSHPTS